MSGHNKFSKIKHKKAATDAQKSKIFSKIARLLSVESRLSGGDINSPNLRAIIEKARTANMPKDNIERAIKKGASDDSSKMEPITYEAYGPGGCAIIIEVLTDNRNKASAEIKHLLSKHDLSLAGIGSAVWAFEKDKEGRGWTPKIGIALSEEDAKNLEKIIEELEDNDDVQEVFTNAE